MPHIRITTTSAALSHDTPAKEAESRLSFAARQGDEDEVTIGNGEVLADLSGSLFVTVATESAETAGTLSYCEPLREPSLGIRDPATFICELGVSAWFFGELLAAARLGRLPEVTLDLGWAGISYGMAPDGSQKEWNVEAHPQLTVEKATFHIPLIVDARSSEEL